MAHDDKTRSHDVVRESFGPSAARYSTSAVHADAAALARFVARVDPEPRHRVLDVATGAGHLALAFTPAVARVVAVDVTFEMLVEVRRNAGARGVTSPLLAQAAAEILPFVDASFDLVVCRIAAHHFADLAAAVDEMARVLKPGGRLAIFDTMAPEDDDLDREINDLERLRDPSHVRNHRPSEWRALVTAAGLSMRELDSDVYGQALGFNDWTARLRTPPETVRELRQRLTSAGAALRDALRIDVTSDDIQFALPRVFLIAVKSATP